MKFWEFSLQFKMEVKANVNRQGKISQIKALHLEVFSSLIVKIQAEITFFVLQGREISLALMQLHVY